jgi:integrase
MPRKRREVPWLDVREDTGTYCVYWYDAGKRRTERQSLDTKDPVEATTRYALFLTEGRAVYSGGGGKSSGLTCKEAFDHYLAEHVRVKVVDATRQEDAIRNLRMFFDRVEVKAIDIPMSREYATQRMSGAVCIRTKKGAVRKASAGTVKRELSTLLAAINHCVAWKKPGISAGDVPKIEKPKTKRSKGLWLFHEELQALRAAADQKTRDFIDLCYWTAARKRSIETLTWFQVDLARGRINLAKPDDPETKKRKPIVPIAPELRIILERLRPETVSSGWVLGTSASMWSGFKTARRKAGLKILPSKDMRVSGSCSPHVLRHSRATHLLQKGAKPKFVADLLGDDIMTVLRVYGHACPDWMESEMNSEEGS